MGRPPANVTRKSIESRIREVQRQSFQAANMEIFERVSRTSSATSEGSATLPALDIENLRCVMPELRLSIAWQLAAVLTAHQAAPPHAPLLPCTVSDKPVHLHSIEVQILEVIKDKNSEVTTTCPVTFKFDGRSIKQTNRIDNISSLPSSINYCGGCGAMQCLMTPIVMPYVIIAAQASQPP